MLEFFELALRSPWHFTGTVAIMWAFFTGLVMVISAIRGEE